MAPPDGTAPTVTVDAKTIQAMATAAAMNEVQTLTEGPYRGQLLKGRLLQDGEYAGEQLASSPSGFSCIAGDEFGGFTPGDLKYLHGDLTHLGTSKLFLDADSTVKGGICFETNKEARGSNNERILKKTNSNECVRAIGKEKCNAIHEVVEKAQGEQSGWDKFVDGLWTGLGFTIAGGSATGLVLVIRALLKGRGGGDGGTPTRGGEKNQDAKAVAEAAAVTAMVAAMVMLAKKVGEEMARMMPQLAMETGAGVFTESAFVASEPATAEAGRRPNGWNVRSLRRLSRRWF